MIFEINGYWKDDKSEFSGYLVNEFDEVPEGHSDDDMFYYGLSESEIKESIKTNGDDMLEFTITEYKIKED
jgi:hypothetical protein